MRTGLYAWLVIIYKYNNWFVPESECHETGNYGNIKSLPRIPGKARYPVLPFNWYFS